MSSRRGCFITFEGIDASGKSTQIRHLFRFLENEGLPVLMVREPGGTRIGEHIRQILLAKEHGGMADRTELLLYEAARSQIVAEKIRPALEEGKVVICDRFYDSTVAYQGGARGIDTGMIDQLNQFAAWGLVPDLTFVLDLSPSGAIERLRQRNSGCVGDRLEEEGADFMHKVRDRYLKMAQSHRRFIVVDGAQDEQAIKEQIQSRVWEVLHR